MRPAVISQKFHTRGAAMIMVAVAALYVALSGGIDNVLPSSGDCGLGLPSASRWVLPYGWSLAINVGLNILIMAMMVIINKAFNVLRAMTWLEVGLFALMQAAVPRDVTAIGSGTLVAAGVVICTFLLFSCYDAPDRVRTVFLAFMLLSLGSATQYSFAFYIPVFWVVCMQMRIFNLRVFLASVMGILTVWILLAGLGIVSPVHIGLPDISAIFFADNLHSSVYLLTVTALTAFMLVASIALNVFKTIAYNARARSYNGALTIIAAFTVAAMALDFDNLLTYLPILNVCAAYQITHYFVNHRYDRQYIGILAVAGVYIALYLWRLTL
ncbi:MAG: hypothetical protein Q4C34_05285 [Bacteroidales bacterium]|nr:hypothetical protein [Bacteroidales bacterium]